MRTSGGGLSLARRRGLAATALALGALIVIAVLLAAGVRPLTAGALVLLFGASAGLGYAIALVRSGSDAASRRPAGQLMSKRFTPDSIESVPSDLRVSTQRSQADVAEQRRIAAIERYLRDVRDVHGCARVTLWRAEEVGAPLAPMLTLGDSEMPVGDREVSLVAWSAESRLTVTLGEPTARFVAAPVGTGTLVTAVLALEQPAGFAHSVAQMKEWASRHAEHVALLFELFDAREEFQRQRRHTTALLRAAHRIQSKTTLHELGEAICETALDVTSASRAALIGWNDRDEFGTVEGVSPGHHLERGMRVTPDSVVGQACIAGFQMTHEDARHLNRSQSVYGPQERLGPLGSLGITPLKHGEATVLGAVVLEGDAPGDVLSTEVRHVILLGAVAATSLRLAWDFEETVRRAHTDQLTGLNNRRFFDEQLHRVFIDADRYGRTTSLVICDLDHFKRVNDSFGHDAGDAVLRHVAAIFLEQVRAADICARFGGEEIAVVLPATPSAGAIDFAERVRTILVSRPPRYKGVEIHVTASFGVASYPDVAKAHEDLFMLADRALYEAKREGRNRTKVAGAPAETSST